MYLLIALEKNHVDIWSSTRYFWIETNIPSVCKTVVRQGYVTDKFTYIKSHCLIGFGRNFNLFFGGGVIMVIKFFLFSTG